MVKWCKNVEFFTKNAVQTCKYKILFKIVSKYEKNHTIHNMDDVQHVVGVLDDQSWVATYTAVQQKNSTPSRAIAKI